MNTSRVTVLLTVLVAPLLLTADEPKVGQPKSPKARAAITKYDRAVEKAKADYDRAVAAAGKAMLTELELAKKQAMKADNLPEASAIQAVAERTKQEFGERGTTSEESRQAPGLKGLIGKWVVRYGNGAEREYVIAPDGRVTFNDGPTAPIRKTDDGLLVDFNDGKVERLHLVDGLLIIEHFDPKSTLASGRFASMGGGRRK